MKIGSLDVSKIYLGSDAVDKAYLGSDLVYSSTSPRLPKEYQELKYIQTNNQAAFKVPFDFRNLSNGAPGFDIDFCLPVNDTSTLNFTILGVYASSGYTDWSLYRRNNNAASMPGTMCISMVSSGSTKSYDLKYNFNASNPNALQFASVRNKEVTCFDGSTFTTGAHYSRYDKATYCGIGNQWNATNNNFAQRYYTQYFNIGCLALYLGTTKKYDFVPAKRLSDNKPGMYNLLNNTFYPSTTGTDFLAGPAI